jgi:GT2 family glycosyltransferase
MSYKNKIPVIGTATIIDTYWLRRLIASVDYPVESFFIINNGNKEYVEELDEIARQKHRYIENFHVTHLPTNLGVSGAWNLIIKLFLNAPYWVIVNDDVSFGPGFLKEMNEASQEKDIQMVFGKTGPEGLPSYDLFLMKDWVVQNYGLFDENFYPAYCEDMDHIMKMALAPFKYIPELSATYYHGETTDYNVSGSQTKKSNIELREKIERAHVMNKEYLTEKWGPGCWNLSPTSLPFEGKKKANIDYDLEFNRKKFLGF